jgi:ABC-type transport system involved in multi-copper enzyme maturation permease subunit
MRPYLAVIKDSFREAFASRVLWILLVIITLFLLAVAPFSLQRELGAMLRRSDLLDLRGFIEELTQKSQEEQSSPEKHVWLQLSEDLRKEFEILDENSPPRKSIRIQTRLQNELNDLLRKKDFYDAAAWGDIALDDEGRELLKRDRNQLDDEQTARLNRLLLDAAFGDYIAPVSSDAMRPAYFGYKFGNPMPLNEEQLQDRVNMVLTQLMIYLAGVIGVMIAILVTASVVPQMFEAGAIDLLLSKPTSRTLLFLTKFFGGCAFIVLNAAYFIVGLWLIAGLRFDIWNGKLLLCIPVFLFLFAIYYSVSSLAGVIWKNAVISVVITILFWGVCFTTGLAKNLMETFLNPQRHSVVVQADETLIVTNKAGKVFRWQADRSEWDEIFQGSGPDAMTFGFFYPFIGPVYDQKNDRLVAVYLESMGFQRSEGTGTLLIGSGKADWNRQESIRTPAGAKTLFIDPQGNIVVAGTGGIHRFDGEPLQQSDKEGQFVKIGGPAPESYWRTPFHAAMHPVSGNLLAFHAGNLTLLKRGGNGKYTLDRTNDLKTNEEALIAYAGKRMVSAFGNGKIRVSQDPLCRKYQTFEPFGNNEPRSVSATPDGRWFAVLFHHRKLWLYDATKQEVVSSRISGQGDISAVTFSSNNLLLVSDRFGRVSEYQLHPAQLKKQMETPGETLELVYRYGVKPLYTIFPKPGELDNLVSYLLTDQETQAVGGQGASLQSERAVLNIWEPVWSNLAFLTVMLALTCLYISRRDF